MSNTKGCKTGSAAVARGLTVLQDVSAAFPLSCLFFIALTNCKTNRAVVEGMSKEPNELFSILKLVLIQKRHPYTGNLNSETPGDSKNAFLHWGDVLDVHNSAQGCLSHYQKA